MKDDMTKCKQTELDECVYKIIVVNKPWVGITKHANELEKMFGIWLGRFYKGKHEKAHLIAVALSKTLNLFTVLLVQTGRIGSIAIIIIIIINYAIWNCTSRIIII